MVKSLRGNEPWKILIRNNILRFIIMKGKLWKDIPLMDIVFGDFNMKIFGSKIFQVFWKAWIQVRQYIMMRGVVGGPPHYLVKDRYIWWGLSYNVEHFSLTQSCSAKAWNLERISLIQDTMDDGQLREWEDIKCRFNIPDS